MTLQVEDTMRHLLLLSTLVFGFSLYSAATVQAALDKNADYTKIGVVGAAQQNLAATDQQQVKRALVTGDDVIFNETISTDAQGKSQLIFIDKSTLTIGPNSSVTIDKFVFDPATSTGDLTMSGTKGVFRFVGGALSKKKAVTFKTPVATIGIRGGIGVITVDGDTGKTEATFLYGVEMTVTNDAGTVQTTVPGTMIATLNAEVKPLDPVKVAPEYVAGTTDSLQMTSGDPATETEEESAGDTADAAPAEGSTTDSGGSTLLSEEAAPAETSESDPAPNGPALLKDTSTLTALASQTANTQPPVRFQWFDVRNTTMNAADGRFLLDMERNKYFGGNLKWAERKMVTAYGNVDKTATDPSFLKHGYSFDYHASPVQTINNDTLVSYDQNVRFADGRIDGFQFTTTGGGGTDAMLATSTQLPTPGDMAALWLARTGSMPVMPYKGFVTAMVGNEVWMNDGPGQFTITRTSTGDMSAHMNALSRYSTSGLSPIGATGSDFNFGADNTEEALINDRMFSMSDNAANGVLVSGLQYMNPGAARCDSCRFVDWGVWSDATVGMAPYVYGLATPMLGTPSTGSLGDAIRDQVGNGTGIANYSGVSVGMLNTAGTITNVQGGFNATIDFNTRNLTSFNITNFGGYNIAGTVSSSGGYIGMGQFQSMSGTVSSSGGTVTINGALFGPMAENIGGNFAFSQAGTAGAGVYLGAR